MSKKCEYAVVHMLTVGDFFKMKEVRVKAGVLKELRLEKVHMYEKYFPLACLFSLSRSVNI